jgi:CRISPR-associated protein Cas2
MTVIVANNTSPAIRGVLRRWFIEPQPNVFVGEVNAKVRQKALDYVCRKAPMVGLLIVTAEANCQGFSIRSLGNTKRMPVDLGGLCLIDSSKRKSFSCARETPPS